MISFALMCHPARSRFVEELQRQLPQAQVVWDERNDRIDTGFRALAAFDPEATHHAVIQDDAIVCSDLAPALERIVDVVPDNPISLYTGRTRPREQLVRRAARAAERRHLSWVVLDDLNWGVGVVLPVPLIEEMLKFDRIANAQITNYDARMSFFFASRGIRTFYTQPSLVDHRDVGENPSLVPGRHAAGRVAHRFIGDESPLDIDWETKALHLDSDNRQSVAEPHALARRKVRSS